jgi:group I intron endonuclease
MVKEIQARKANILALYDDQKSKMGVYHILCLVNGKRYLGSTLNFRNRWRGERSCLNKSQRISNRLQKDWDEHGSGAFIWEILEYIYKDDLLGVIEDEYIARFKSAHPKFGYNLRPSSERQSEETRKKIGDANRNKKRSVEVRQKMKEAHKGNKHTVEARQKISEAKKGKERSAEVRQKISEANKGKKRSAEVRQKMGEAKKAENLSLETRQKLSEAGRKRKQNAETRQKISESHKVENLSVETRQNISEGQRGRKHSLETRQKISEARKAYAQRIKEQKQEVDPGLI